MFYDFRCDNCGEVQEKEICIKDYDRVKNSQTCNRCGGTLKRIIEWQGGAYNLGGYSDIGGTARWQSGSVVKSKNLFENKAGSNVI